MKKICVIGGGAWGENHIRTLSELGCLAAIVEPSDARRTQLLEKYKAVGFASVDEAIAHINAHNTKHSEAIMTTDQSSADRFLKEVDAACVYVNASTRFTDGGVFGLGCEMGISTQRLHARGPMGLCELNTYKYIIRGKGQIR